MTTPDPPPIRGHRYPPVPWWLGRGVGLALVALMVAVGWTMSWGIAAEVESEASPVTPWWQEDTATTVTVTSRTVTASPEVRHDDAPSRDRGLAPAPAPAPRDDDQASPATGPGSGRGSDRERTSSPPAEQSLPPEVLQERRRERTERALQADQDLAAFIESVGVLDVLSPWVTPIDASYRITATFGQGGSLWSNDHTGVDLAAPSGTPVATVAAGTVTHAGDAGAYGLRVEVTHTDGTETSYSHLSRIDVTEGQVIGQGTTVGAVGSTGNSTGPHLHLELRPDGGDPVDPVDALLARGVVL